MLLILLAGLQIAYASAYPETRIFSVDDLTHFVTGDKRPADAKIKSANEGAAKLVANGVSYNSEKLAMDGSLGNRVTCGHGSMKTCWVVYDLGAFAVHTVPARLEYFQCQQPGFTNGGVKDLVLEVADNVDGPFTVVIEGTVNEYDTKEKRMGGDVQSFSTPESKSKIGGRFWRFRAVNDHGNGSYRWFCEFRLYAIHKGGYAFNAALGKPTEESGVWNSRCTDCYNADRLVDGRLPLFTKNSVENCFHSAGANPAWVTIDLEEETEVTSITITGRNHQTNQGDNLKVSVGNQRCGGDDKVWHTNGKGGQVYTKDIESSTVAVPCNLTGSSIRIEAETTGGALVLCEVEAWATYKAPNPKNECDGCAWRLRSCAANLDHWDVDHIEFKLKDGQQTSGGDSFASGSVAGFGRGSSIYHLYGAEDAFGQGDNDDARTTVWSGRPDKVTGEWYIGQEFDRKQEVVSVEYLQGECRGQVNGHGANGADGGTHTDCVELQKWDGDKWLTVNWHDDLESCKLLEPAGRTLECTDCPVAKLNDGTCDANCNVEACGFDGDDCTACDVPATKGDGEDATAFISSSDESNIWKDGKGGSIFGVGTTATWGCNEGQGLPEGTPSTSTCTAESEWEPAVPDCIDMFCNDPTPPPSEPSGVLKLSSSSKGTGTDGKYGYREVAYYECTGVHHQLVGETSRTCVEGGEWSHPSPTCVRSSCPALAVPDNGLVEMNGGGDDIATGTVAKISCDLGYTMSVSEKGADVQTCGKDGWSSSEDSTVTCTIVDCGEPPLIQKGAGKVTPPTATIYNSVATYSCNRGWLLSQASNERTCNAKGLWSGNDMVCEQVLCKTLQAPRNGNMAPPKRATGESFFATAFETVTFGCEEAYYLEGNKGLDCGIDSEWSGSGEEPTCELKTCVLPRGLPFTSVSAVRGGRSNSVNFGDSALFKCDKGYVLPEFNYDVEVEVLCQSGDGDSQAGAFVVANPECKPIVCGVPPEVESRELLTYAADQTTFGTVIEFDCSFGWEGSGGTMVCDFDGAWFVTRERCTATTTTTTITTTTSITTTTMSTTTVSTTTATTTTTIMVKAKYLKLNSDALEDLGKTAADMMAEAIAFTPTELSEAGFSASDIADAAAETGKFSPTELKSVSGMTASKLERSGFSANDVRAAGYSAEQMAVAGYSASEIEASAAFAPANTSSTVIIMIVAVFIILVVVVVAFAYVKKNASNAGNNSSAGAATSFENPMYDSQGGGGGGGGYAHDSRTSGYMDVPSAGFGGSASASNGYMDVAAPPSKAQFDSGGGESSDEEV